MYVKVFKMKDTDKAKIIVCVYHLKKIREVISVVNVPLEGRISHKLTGCCIKLNAIMSVLENVLRDES